MSYKTFNTSRQNDIELLKSQGLKPEHKILDIGCGGGRLGHSLINYLNSGNYYGFDKQAGWIKNFKRDVANARLQDKNPTILNCDFNWPINRGIKFDYAYAYSVFSHVDPDLVKLCLQNLRKHFEDSSILFASYCPNQSEDTFSTQGGVHDRGGGEFVEVWYNPSFFDSILNECGMRQVPFSSAVDKIGPGNALVDPSKKPTTTGRFANQGSYQQIIAIKKK